VRISSKLKLTISQIKGLRSFRDYIKKGIEGLKISKNHGGRRKPRITDESREIILSVLFNVSLVTFEINGA